MTDTNIKIAKAFATDGIKNRINEITKSIKEVKAEIKKREDGGVKATPSSLAKIECFEESICSLLKAEYEINGIGKDTREAFWDIITNISEGKETEMLINSSGKKLNVFLMLNPLAIKATSEVLIEECVEKFRDDLTLRMSKAMEG